MEKVVLTKTQANFLDDKLNHAKMLPQNIVFGFANPSSNIVGEIFIEHFDLDTLIKALYIGYEIEKEPEERLLEYYETCEIKAKAIIQHTLECLDITVKGIND